MGHDIMNQILGTLLKLAGTITTFSLSLLRKIGEGNSVQEIQKLNNDKQMAAPPGSGQYASYNFLANVVKAG
jgi:hypothetical protein